MNFFINIEEPSLSLYIIYHRVLRLQIFRKSLNDETDK
jgi:hypothetical protein